MSTYHIHERSCICLDFTIGIWTSSDSVVWHVLFKEFLSMIYYWDLEVENISFNKLHYSETVICKHKYI